MIQVLYFMSRWQVIRTWSKNISILQSSWRFHQVTFVAMAPSWVLMARNCVVRIRCGGQKWYTFSFRCYCADRPGEESEGKPARYLYYQMTKLHAGSVSVLCVLSFSQTYNGEEVSYTFTCFTSENTCGLRWYFVLGAYNKSCWDNIISSYRFKIIILYMKVMLNFIDFLKKGPSCRTLVHDMT